MLKREGLTVPAAVLAVVLVLFAGIGTVYDYAVSQTLYSGSPTLFGDLFAAFGELPAYFLLHSVGIMLFRHRGKSSRFKDIFFLLGSIALFLLGILGQFCELIEDLPQMPILLAILITVVQFALNHIFTLVLMRNSSREDILRFIMAVLFVCVISMLAANLLKHPWSRPRMQFLAEHPDAVFSPWYRLDPGMKKQFVEQGIAANAFRSFPSGHTVTAAASLLWTLYPTLHRTFEGRSRLLFLLSVIWTLLVTLSRIMSGAHFLTDVTISWLFTLILYILAVFLFYRDSWAYRLAYKLLT